LYLKARCPYEIRPFVWLFTSDHIDRVESICFGVYIKLSF